MPKIVQEPTPRFTEQARKAILTFWHANFLDLNYILVPGNNYSSTQAPSSSAQQRIRSSRKQRSKLTEPRIPCEPKAAISMEVGICRRLERRFARQRDRNSDESYIYVGVWFHGDLRHRSPCRVYPDFHPTSRRLRARYGRVHGNFMREVLCRSRVSSGSIRSGSAEPRTPSQFGSRSALLYY